MNRKNLISAAAALALGILAWIPASAAPPDWAPAHGYRAKQARQHQYVYYPARQVYYAPETRNWFWLNGGNWQVGATLPGQFRAYVTDGVSVSLTSGRPYVQHVYVEEQYGRPWRDRHGYRHDDHHHGKHKDKHKDKHHDKHGGKHHGRD